MTGIGMDRSANNMDFLITHWGPFPRRFPSPFQLVSCNDLRTKGDRVRTTFYSCNFSLILRGRGTYIRKGQTHLVEAPCVITQWPGEPLDYGPLEGESWTELYMIYPAKLMGKLKQCGFIEMDRPIWPIANPSAVELHREELRRYARSSTPEEVVDYVDRLCERMILETLQAPACSDPEELLLRELVSEVQRDLRTPIDLGQEAQRRGMSLSTFRRRWKKTFDAPPARYLTQLRIWEASRLLVETLQPVGEIARKVGFEDDLYFSRRFRQVMKMPPREYRRAFQYPSP